MITTMDLHDSICNFLEKEVASKIQLKSTNSNEEEFFRNPRVVRSGWLLPGSIDEKQDYSTPIEDAYPFIMPRIHKVEHIGGQVESVVTMDVFFGVYAKVLFDEDGIRVNDGSGYRDLWNLIESTGQAFFEQQIIDGKYRIIQDFFEANTIDELMYPQWEGVCTTKWHIMLPMPKPVQNFF